MARESNLPLVFFAVFFFIMFVISKSAVLYSDLLWFRALGYGSVFMTILSARLGIFLLATFLFFSLVSLNAYIAERDGKRKYITIAIISAVAGLILSGSWEIILRYMNQAQFGIIDPVFSRDIGFYVFTLPFYRFIQNFLFLVIFLSIITVTVIYLKKGDITLIKSEPVVETDEYIIPRQGFPITGLKISKGATAHFYGLIAFFFLSLTLKHFLDRFNVLYSESGVIFGAGYADIHAFLPVLSLLIFISIISAILFFTASVLASRAKFNIRGLLIVMVVVYLLAVFVGTGMYPAVIQQYRVLPNEISLEKEYIERNIEYTRIAYGLNNIKEVAIIPNENISLDYISENQDIIKNIRLWDWRPLKQTYKQMQEIRSYYDFNDVDVDRYSIGKEYTQVMLSAREMDYEQLSPEAKTWVNKHLLYTHGYGICMSPANKFTEGGLPEFFVKDIPPRSTLVDELSIERPEIYYGEKTDNFVIVKTTTEEFDYPLGDENKFTTYTGTGGVALNSFIKKLIMSIRFADINLILSHYTTPESRIMFNRNIHQRVREIAPFLLYDPDPYVVTVDGKTYWIQDAYTHTDRYPYSMPYGDINYIRNSVKVVIDAYNGDTVFYVVDSEDPMIKTYMNIFPDLFRKFEEMPNGLKKHIRYPEGLFSIQANLYGIYHMTDPTVFYNKEDKWVIPNEIYGQGTKQEMVPYYIITRLPEEESLEFILMIPLTPKNKDNMIAWMGAKCDKDYGELIVYKFPKEKLIYGPMQIEARVDQDDQISQQLTLWSQYGSDVIRGNILIIPVEDTLLYVEPLYIKAEQATMPELKRVIVSYESRVVMERNLDLAFSKLFEIGSEEIPEGTVGIMENRTIEQLIDLALEHYSTAQLHIKEGNWTGFGEELQELGKTLVDMRNVTG